MSPSQMVALDKVTTGIGFTVTIAFTLGLVQLFRVYVTEYVVVVAGLT